jgi:3-deoxy-D-manno-octulosonate 8-phosphate phosphatase (KDO 8-P phosphatase)
MLDRHGIAPSEAAFLGDDFPDLAVLRLVGLPVAVGNAASEIRAECKVQLTRTGGNGAIREFAELLLRARGEWESVTHRYVAERSLPSGDPR